MINHRVAPPNNNNNNPIRWFARVVVEVRKAKKWIKRLQERSLPLFWLEFIPPNLRWVAVLSKFPVKCLSRVSNRVAPRTTNARNPRKHDNVVGISIFSCSTHISTRPSNSPISWFYCPARCRSLYHRQYATDWISSSPQVLFSALSSRTTPIHSLPLPSLSQSESQWVSSLSLTWTPSPGEFNSSLQLPVERIGSYDSVARLPPIPIVFSRTIRFEY